MKSLAILALSISTAVAAFAQNVTVTGRVVDEQDEPMIAAGVVLAAVIFFIMTPPIWTASSVSWFPRGPRWFSPPSVISRKKGSSTRT